MRTILTIFAIILLLGSFIAGEQIFVNNFCTDFSEEIKELKTSVNTNNNPQYLINRIADNWEKQKNNIFIFANHNNFKEIETGIYNIEHSINTKKYSDAQFYINALYHRIKELKESTGLTLGNLL